MSIKLDKFVSIFARTLSKIYKHVQIQVPSLSKNANKSNQIRFISGNIWSIKTSGKTVNIKTTERLT